MITHAFSCYRLRRADLGDVELAAAWTKRDPEHAGRVLPEFWIEQGIGVESWVLFDKQGPVFFFKSVVRNQILEVHIQFPPYPIAATLEKQAQHKRRMSLALIEGMRWLEQRVKGFFLEIRFDSRDSKLIHFAEKHLGFTNQNGQLAKRLQAQQGGA